MALDMCLGQAHLWLVPLLFFGVVFVMMVRSVPVRSMTKGLAASLVICLAVVSLSTYCMALQPEQGLLSTSTTATVKAALQGDDLASDCEECPAVHCASFKGHLLDRVQCGDLHRRLDTFIIKDDHGGITSEDCRRYVKQFGCSTLGSLASAPCGQTLLPPCRSLCHKVRESCNADDEDEESMFATLAADCDLLPEEDCDSMAGAVRVPWLGMVLAAVLCAAVLMG